MQNGFLTQFSSIKMKLVQTWAVFLSILLQLIRLPCTISDNLNYVIKEFPVPKDHFCNCDFGTFNIRYAINDTFMHMPAPTRPLPMYLDITSKKNVEIVVYDNLIANPSLVKIEGLDDEDNDNDKDDDNDDDSKDNIKDTHKVPEFPPILFYTGGVEKLEDAIGKAGILWKLGLEFRGVVVIAEHRYYGKSIPETDAHPTYKYLSINQVIEDYVSLINHLRTWDTLKNSSVILFGTGYAGLLSAWMTMKYPDLVQGAIASSTPIIALSDDYACNTVTRKVTKEYRLTDPICRAIVSALWPVINRLTAVADGRKYISNYLNLCKPIRTREDVVALKVYIRNYLINQMMYNFPYFTAELQSYFREPDPCTFVSDLYENVREYMDKHREIYNIEAMRRKNPEFRPDGNIENEKVEIKLNCINLSKEEDSPQYYQMCTELPIPTCSDGKSDMFEPSPWDFQEFSNSCFKAFGVRPNRSIICNNYPCKVKDIVHNSSRIVYSNGFLDPWYKASIPWEYSDGVTMYNLGMAAHGLDLRENNEFDFTSVRLLRRRYREFIRVWKDVYAIEKGIATPYDYTVTKIKQRSYKYF